MPDLELPHSRAKEAGNLQGHRMASEGKRGRVPPLKHLRPSKREEECIGKWTDARGGGGQSSHFCNQARLVVKLCQHMPGVQKVRVRNWGSRVF